MIGHEKNTGTVRNQTRSNLLELARKIHAQSQKCDKCFNKSKKTQNSAISTKRCQYHQKSTQTIEHIKHHESACHDPEDLAFFFDNWHMPSLSAGRPRDPFMKACELTGKHSIRVPEQILLDCAINESVSDYLTT